MGSAREIFSNCLNKIEIILIRIMQGAQSAEKH